MPTEHETPHVQTAITLIKGGRPDDAYDVLGLVLQTDLNNAAAWATLAHLLYDVDDTGETEYCLDQVLRIKPGDAPTRVYLEKLRLARSNGHHLAAPPLPGEDLLFHSWLPEVQPARPARTRSLPLPARPSAAGSRTVLMLLGGLLIAGLVAFLLLGPIGFNQRSQAAAPPTTEEPTLPPRPAVQFPANTITDTPAPTPTRTPLPEVTTQPLPTFVPDRIDYQPMIDEITAYLTPRIYNWDYDLGVGFVDIQTGQVLNVHGEDRYHAMSTFKGPLAVYYLWLLEHGVEELPRDYEYVERMLRDSSNNDTTCILQRVGGISSFNDWLAEQNFSRDHNFLFKWADWPCWETGGFYSPEPDWRYSRGNQMLGLPGDAELLTCPLPELPCDKAFAPVELAWFYARLYRGEILGPDHTERVKDWLYPSWDNSIFLHGLPANADAEIFVKGGSRQADEEYRVNFIAEAGVIETPHGAYALAIFMQRYPEWPGTEIMEHVVEITYRHFTAAYDESP